MVHSFNESNSDIDDFTSCAPSSIIAARYILQMTDNLIKFRTEYDIHGKFNQNGLYQAKKQAFQSEIQVANKIQSSTEQQFALHPLEIGFIQSLALKDDPKFKEIQKIYLKYNADVAEQGEQAVEGLHLKTVVMDSMLKFIRLMMLASDTPTKKTILDIAYYWFIKHLNPRSIRKPREAMLREIKQIVAENKLLPREVLEKELPSEVLKDQLYEYRVKARTCYTDIDAPSFELQNYHIHKVAYMNDKSLRADLDPEAASRRKRLMRIDYKRPNLDQYYLPREEELKETEKQDPQIVLAPPEGEPKAAQGAEGVSADPPALTAEQQQMELLMNQMGGEAEEAEEGAGLEEEDKKRGKLEPFVKVFLLKQQAERERQEGFQCAPVSQLQRLKGNYREMVQREDDNLKGYMVDWAAHRSRFKTQVNRKMQSMRAFKDMSGGREPLKVEEGMYKTRIQEAIREGKGYIKRELNKESLNTEAGLSCFDRRRIKTAASSEGHPKPFSEILEENKRINKRDEFLDEIEDIKLKFAKQKIFTSMNAMKNGLMHPEEKEEGEELDRVEYPTSLLSNPFFVVKKKKKKGKKKK